MACNGFLSRRMRFPPLKRALPASCPPQFYTAWLQRGHDGLLQAHAAITVKKAARSASACCIREIRVRAGLAAVYQSRAAAERAGLSCYNRVTPPRRDSDGKAL